MSHKMARMRLTTALLCAPLLVRGLELLPPLRHDIEISTDAVWDSKLGPSTIYVEDSFASLSDDDGLTLIPPSGYDFAELFQQDISQATGRDWDLQRVDRLPDSANASGILLGHFTGNASTVVYENGVPTSEGYVLDVSTSRAFIGGTGARGMWWGTRTVLQHLLLRNGTVPVQRVGDAPAYATRGFMLDAGRKWYAPGFLKELCSFASFFKMNEFHYHLSDNCE